VAEDNEYTLKQYKTALEKKGHKVTLTKDGVECIDLYHDEAKYAELFKKNTSPPFDVVLLDHNMPRKSGAQVAQEILKIRRNQRIIFLSAYGKAILENITDVKDDSIQIIQKPFSLDFLIKKIEGRINNSRAGRTLKDRILGEQVNNLMTITQDQEAIR
jgi:two-component system cell cycle response regulator CpdR